MAAVTCHLCKKKIYESKIVINERWTCAECVYRLEQAKEGK